MLLRPSFICSWIIPVIILGGSIATAHSRHLEPLPDSLISYWHKAYFAETSNDLDGIIEDYTQVMRYSAGLPPHLRDWYLASAYYGIARANAIIGDREATRAWLDSALEHHFWNFEMIRLSTAFQPLLSKGEIDSICDVWHTIAVNSAPSWPPEPPIFIRPSKTIPGKKYPVVIALHGGNGSYEVFSRRLCRLPDTLGAIVVCFPGQLRISETSNAWGIDMPQCIGYLDQLFDQVAEDPQVDVKHVTMTGFSQGSQVCYAYCCAHPERVHEVVAFAGFASQVLQEPDLDMQLHAVAKHGIRIVAISGKDDFSQFLESTRELQARAHLAGVNFKFTLDPTLPHGIPEHVAEYLGKVCSNARTIGEAVR
jgi:pimeloyl-ACP methyl ester carboxylesterase